MHTTIYDQAPAIFGLAIAIIGYTVCKRDHDQLIARREARRLAEAEKR